MSGSVEASRRPTRRRDSIPAVPDSRIRFSCDRPDEWSEPCFIKTSGSRTFPARVCVRAGTRIMADVKLYKNLKGGIQGLFERFAEDLVQQKTPNVTESSRFSEELLDVLKTDYIEQTRASRSVAANIPRRVEPYYFLLVERLDDTAPETFAAGYIFSQGYGDILYIRHLASEVERSNMGGALMAVAMNAALRSGHTTAILNFNPKKAYLQKVYERLGFVKAQHKRMFVDDDGKTLFDKVHSWGMFKALTHTIDSVRVGVMQELESHSAPSMAATRKSPRNNIIK